MLIETKRTTFQTINVTFIIALSLLFIVAGSSAAKPQSPFTIHHRVVAHGDEFNAIAMSADGGRLFIGTEKGEVLIWSISDNRIVRRLNQGSPVHALALLNGKELLAAGGNHFENLQSAVVRKWNLNNGSSEEWTGMANDSVLYLRVNPNKDLAVASSMKGRIVAWKISTGKPIATWDIPNSTIAGLAFIGKTIYFTTIDSKALQIPQLNSIKTLNIDQPDKKPEDLIAQKSQIMWTLLSAAPDGQFLLATHLDASARKSGLAVVDPANGNIQRIVEGTSASWFAPDSAIIFDASKPIKSILFQKGTEEIWGQKQGWHAQGSPSEMIDLAVAADGKTAFTVYRKGAALARWEQQKDMAEMLTMTLSNIYSMDILLKDDKSGLVLTGGDDGYVRAWSLPEFSLRREFRVENEFPQGVALLDNGNKAVFSYSGSKAPTAIFVADLGSGEKKQILSIDKPYVRVKKAGDKFVYQNGSKIILADQNGVSIQEYALNDVVHSFSVSANGKWLAAADKQSALYLFEVGSGKNVQQIKTSFTQPLNFAAANDGRIVFVTDWQGMVHRWKTGDNDFKSIAGVRGQTASLQLSADERLLVRGGNHRDVSIYNVASGKEITSFPTEAADFNVTNVWLKDKRLIFTTDSGVLLDNTLP
jgi:WD40 repeat protein